MTREQLISHILWMRRYDEDYARQALIDYDRAMPWMGLKAGVRDALALRQV